MAITNELEFTPKQLVQFARLFKATRLKLGLSQLDVARMAFDYAVSHCKVSRVERCVMPRVDAYAVSRLAAALGLELEQIEEIDPKFKSRWEVTQLASEKGFWRYAAA